MARKKVKTRISYVLQFLKSNYLLVGGIILILIFVGWRYHQVRILSFNTLNVETNQVAGITPVYIKAYPVGVDIAVTPTAIKDGVWIIPPQSVGFLSSSYGLGGGGNIIMYGHNKDDILGPIRWIKNDSIVQLTGVDGKIYKYKVTETAEVDPNNLDYIKPTTEEVLTLYTCTGILDSKRFVVRARLIQEL